MSATRRTLEDGRLFAAEEWDHGWQLSIQADRDGYRCSPAERLETLEEYETVEVKIDGPHGTVVDPHTMDLPPETAAKFPRLDGSGGPSIGAYLGWEDVDAVRRAIRMAARWPNNGVPNGSIGWAGREVFHGSSQDAADDIVANGISTAMGTGYFGQAFYVAEDVALARSNYADFSGGDGGAVVSAVFAEDARILDLRNAEDAGRWTALGLANRIGERGFDRLARAAGVDAVYDRSVGGLAVYNARALGNVRKIADGRVMSPNRYPNP